MSDHSVLDLAEKPIVSIAMTIRCSSLQRKKNLMYVVDLLSEIPDVEIIIVEQDIKPSLSCSDFSQCCKYKFVFNDQKFNKSWGINIATELARSDVLCIHDADMILDTQTLYRAISEVLKGREFVKPYGILVDLTSEETEYLICGGTELNIDRAAGQIDRNDKGQYPPICGGIFVISKNFFFEIGGMDERFSGWGGEDDAMSYRVQNQDPETKVYKKSIAFHLWHQKSAHDKSDSAQYIHNMAILSAYLEIGDSLISKFTNDIKTNANENKYLPLEPKRNHSSLPLISCLCITRDRVKRLKRAIFCFNQQTYLSKELIIVCESDDSQTISYIESLSSPNIRYFVLDSSAKYGLGELRNFALKKADGEYFCQWDDDDYYHHSRLSSQFYHCQKNGKAASILSRWLIYSEPNRAAYISNTRLWEGSILCRMNIFRSKDVYLPQSRGEEVDLITQLLVKNEIAIIDAPELYVYCHSGKNTWDDSHFSKILQASHKLNVKQTELLEKKLDHNTNTETVNSIPKIIHQTHFFQKQDLPKQLAEFQKLLVDLHPSWQHEFYQDKDCRSFIAGNMPELLDVYDNLQLAVQKADLFRLIVIYVQGGFYADIDIELKLPLDPLLNHSCVFAEEKVLDDKSRDELGHKNAIRIANYMFAAAPGHEFIAHLINRIVSLYAGIVTNENDVLNTTGPGMLTRLFHDYPNKQQITIIKNNNQYCDKCQQNSCHFGAYAYHHHQGSWRWHALGSQSKQIHQTWKTKQVPGQLKSFCQGWQDMHPDWTYRLWTDEDNRRLIEEQFPWFLQTYDRYPYNIQRVDAARYFILYKFGGLYVDIDYKMFKARRRFTATTQSCVWLGTSPACQISWCKSNYR